MKIDSNLKIDKENILSITMTRNVNMSGWVLLVVTVPLLDLVMMQQIR